jgi:pimeloyl-ACP methyl ester carboxylesterase
MPTARLNGIEIAFEHGGSGPRLLFINGSGGTIERARPTLDQLRPHFDLAIHDQRGLGQTEVPTTPWTMADHAADALALMDHLGWGTCRVWGISFGGMVAQELAVTAPERVERLALLCTSPGGAGGSSYPLHELAAMDEAERSATTIRIMDTRFDESWLATHPVDRAIVEQLNIANAADKSPKQLLGERLQLEARRHHDVWDRLYRITCPTLVAAGRFDGLAPVSNSEQIVSRIAGAELRVYEGGHLFIAQDRRAIPELTSFLLAP